MTVAGDLASLLLTEYVRGDTMKQTIQDKPLLKMLVDNKKTFSGGTGAISTAVQFAFMSDTAAAIGYSEDTSLNFQQANSALRAQYNWKEHHFGLEITWTELKKDGISIVGDMGNKTSEHSKRDLYVLGGVLDNRMQDFGESWSRLINTTLWSDGTQDANACPGVEALVLDSNVGNTTATTGGLSRATYIGWRNDLTLGVAASADTQALTRRIQQRLLQMKRFGGKPDYALCGSDFLFALQLEAHAKGLQTMENWSKDSNMKLGFGQVSYVGLGTFIYDPTLDDRGKSKYCYIFDSSKLRMRPMEQEWNKAITPARPYNFAVYFASMMSTFALECIQLNAQGIITIA